MVEDRAVAEALTAAARTMNHHHTLDETLQTITEVARRSIPGFDNVGITVIDGSGKIVTRTASDPLVNTLDELQYTLEEGPCVETLRGSPIVTAAHVRHDQRWPRYVPAAARHGLRSQLAVALSPDGDGVVGGLNLYSTVADDIDPEALSLAELFAAHAAIALGHIREREQLNEALGTRKTIGQAIGIIMERYQMSEDRALAYLVRASSHGNIKLRDVARELVDQTNARHNR
jgi:GAF domain-containing protein